MLNSDTPVPAPQPSPRPACPLAEREQQRIIWKTMVVSLIVITTNAVGNYALRAGLADHRFGASWSPLPYIRVMFHPWVAVGVLFTLAWVVTRLVLLSWADLSYVLPVTSFSYVLTAILGVLLLKEHVDLMHWAAIGLIALGVALTGLTFPETTPPKQAEP